MAVLTACRLRNIFMLNTCYFNAIHSCKIHTLAWHKHELLWFRVGYANNCNLEGVWIFCYVCLDWMKSSNVILDFQCNICYIRCRILTLFSTVPLFSVIFDRENTSRTWWCPESEINKKQISSGNMLLHAASNTISCLSLQGINGWIHLGCFCS